MSNNHDPNGNTVNISGSEISGNIAGGNIVHPSETRRRQEGVAKDGGEIRGFQDFLPRLLASVDVIDYSGRGTLQKKQVTEIISRGLNDIREWVNLHSEDVFVQGTGDGFNLLFPSEIEMDKVILKAILGWRHSLIMSNQTARVPVRTRVVFGVGSSSVSYNAIEGEQIVHQTRVLNSAELKEFATSRESLLTLAVDRFIHDNLVQGDLLAGIPWGEGFQRIECAGRDAWLTSC